MNKADDLSEGEPNGPQNLPEASQSATTTRQFTGNSSARRAPLPSNHTERPRSGADSIEDIMHNNLHHRSSYRNESHSGMTSGRHVDADSHASMTELNVEQKTQTNGGSIKHQQVVQPDSREASEDGRSSSIRTEHTYIQRRDLGMLDVAALIINKQIGTGIFTTPGLVLSLTGSKTVSMIMWFCGGIWAFLSIIIYVEFGSAFPFNGGELIYLDEVFRHPELLATVLFSIFFISISNSGGNSIQFAKHILLTANPEVVTTTELDKRLISYIAISVLTLVCFIHYFSRNSGLLLNLGFAVYKIFLVIVFIIFGCIASSRPDNGKSDWGDQPIKSKNVLAAMIYIMYSYQGWENANYVGGELKVKSQSLKRGAFLAVGIVTLLYTLVTMVYSLACTFGELAGQDLGIVSFFAPKAFGSSGAQGIKICIALSAFGNLVAVIYTTTKVKQKIARQCIIPFYKFFARDDPQFMTPAGALILHWVVGVIWILATPNSAGGYAFVIGLFIYGHLVVGVFVGVAFFDIRRNYEADNTRNTAVDGPVVWHPVIFKNFYLRSFCGLLFIGTNLMIMVNSAQGGGDPPSWVRPVVIFGVLLVAFVYWLIIVVIERTSNTKSPIEIRILRDGIEMTAADLAILQKAKLDGDARAVVYEAHGKLKAMLTALDVFLYKIVKLVAR